MQRIALFYKVRLALFSAGLFGFFLLTYIEYFLGKRKESCSGLGGGRYLSPRRENSLGLMINNLTALTKFKLGKTRPSIPTS